MFGIGPMLPVIPAAENVESSSKKLWKRKTKHNTDSGSHELAVVRRPSTIKTGSTLIESDEEHAVKEMSSVTCRQRHLSLIMDFDLERVAMQLQDGDISDLDLALFVFWIKAKKKNYTMAKGLVRELALDQGYNVDKITNLCVRKLLQEVHDIRPRSVPGESPSSRLAGTDGSRHDRPKSLINVVTPATMQRKVWFAAISESTKTWSNKLNLRDPRHASTWQSPFHNQTRTSDLMAGDDNRAVTSLLTARIDTLPPTLRLKRELAVQEAARPTMATNDNTNYPPNTPDRPAPLSVKSRSSQASSSVPVPDIISRSVSTPIHTQTKKGLAPLSQRVASVTNGNIETLSVPYSSTGGTLYRNAGDVFGAVQGKHQDHSNPFTDKLKNSGDTRHGTPGRHMRNEGNSGNSLGLYQLDASDVASESSYGTFSSLVRKSKDSTSTGIPYNGGIIGDAAFDALESYVGTEDEDECSLLESASTISDQEGYAQYRFAVQTSGSKAAIAEPRPTSSERRITANIRRKSQVTKPTSQAINFHRPLPLRSYESKASMFPTAVAHANSGRNRAKSVNSIVNSTRHATETMQHPPAPASGQGYSSAGHTEQKKYLNDSIHTKVSEQMDQSMASISHRSSNASTLAAFPIPTMGNPVGELPMLVSRATASSQALFKMPSQYLAVTTSLEDTYRAIIKVNMVAVLQRTRARGVQLQVIKWDKLSSFERAWRGMNEALLITIYGRKDIFLEETDVVYVDCVARELRNDSSDFASIDWIRRIFEVNS